MTISGGGALLATNEQRSSLVLAADDVTLQEVQLRITSTTRRWDAYEQQRLRIDGHRGIVVRDVSVDGSAAAGVYVGGGTSNFLLERVRVANTRADGIHMTQGAHDGRVVAPLVQNVGDDGVAVVSYAPDGPACARIEIDSPVVDGSSGGRGVSVVGGQSITYRDIDIRRTYGAGVYIAAEGSFDTSSVDGVLVAGGSVRNANASSAIDHGSVLVFNGTPDKTVRRIEAIGLTIEGTRPTVSREVGLVSDSDVGISDVRMLDFTLQSTGSAQPFVSNRDGTTYRTDGWIVNGNRLPAAQNGVVSGG